MSEEKYIIPADPMQDGVTIIEDNEDMFVVQMPARRKNIQDVHITIRAANGKETTIRASAYEIAYIGEYSPPIDTAAHNSMVIQK